MKQIEKKNYRLGIDMGSTSLGWCMLELDEQKEPIGIINMGVRIFPDGRDAKTDEPLSVSRRSYRSQRRNLDRYLQRLKDLVKLFNESGLLPQPQDERELLWAINPYLLRTKALDEKISLGELARAVIHLSKRRGFKSNRKSLTEKDTKLTEAMKNLKERLDQSNCRTLGEYLYNINSGLNQKNLHLQKPLKFKYEKDISEDERIFPTRDMVEHEFNTIWDAQAMYHPELTLELKQKVFNTIFYQRPLKPQIVGDCEFEHGEKRCSKALPIFQEFRLWQDINNLKVYNTIENRDRELTLMERQTLFDHLNICKDDEFKKLRKVLFGKNAGDYKFNFETENRDKLLGNQTNCLFYQKKYPELKVLWHALNDEQKQQLINILIEDSTDEEAIKKIHNLGINPSLNDILLNLHLPAGYGSLSVKAMEKLLPALKQGVKYYQACSDVYGSHSQTYNGEVFDEGNLPYYGDILIRETIEKNRLLDENDPEKRKINNPTVHIALNQLRKIVNALCEKYGAPQDIVLELAREIKLSKKDKDDLIKINKKNKELNDKIADELAHLGLANNYENRSRYKLWQELSDNELDRRCIYSGKQIPISRLFTQEFEIEHILPKSRTFDDSMANKTISHYTANHYKGERSPYETFGNSADGYDWEEILARAQSLPNNKKWRFKTDAMEQFADENQVIGRMLNDTRYMTRVARQYLTYVVGAYNVIAVTGKLTSVLRAKWGLNKALGETDTKERTDHRHHAIDAFVIALTTRSFVHRYATTIKNSRERFLEALNKPYPLFSLEDFQKRISRITVSFKPDQINIALLSSRRQTAGALVDETAYSLIGDDDNNSKFKLYSVSKKITDISIKNCDEIKSPDIRDALNRIAEVSTDDKDFKAKVKDWSLRHNIKKVRLVVKAKPETMIPVKDKNGNIFKYYASGENLFADIYVTDLKNPDAKWSTEIVNSYNVHQIDFIPQWKKQYPMAKLIMRLYKNDIVAIDTPDGERELRRVKKMTNGVVYLRLLSISVKPKGQDDIGEAYSANQLKLKRARKAGVDILGRYFDPIVNEVNQEVLDAGSGDQQEGNRAQY